MFRSSHFWFLVLGHFWRWSYENAKILCNLCLHFARQDGQDRKKRKENHATKVTKIPKTERRKYGMNETIEKIFTGFWEDEITGRQFEPWAATTAAAMAAEDTVTLPDVAETVTTGLFGGCCTATLEAAADGPKTASLKIDWKINKISYHLYCATIRDHPFITSAKDWVRVVNLWRKLFKLHN